MRRITGAEREIGLKLLNLETEYHNTVLTTNLTQGLLIKCCCILQPFYFLLLLPFLALPLPLVVIRLYLKIKPRRDEQDPDAQRRGLVSS